MLILELGNYNHWESVYDHSVTATMVSNSSYLPIPEITIPFLTTARFMAFSVSSNNLESYYKYGGLIKQKFRAGMIVGGGQDITFNSAFKLYLNQISLVELSQYGSESSLIYVPPYYFQNVRLMAWQYTGPITETVDNSLNLIQSDLTVIKNILQP